MKQIYVAKQNEEQDGHEYVRVIELGCLDIIKLFLGEELDIGAYPKDFNNIIIRRKWT